MSSSSTSPFASPIAGPERDNQTQPHIIVNYGGDKATMQRVTDYKAAIALASSQFKSLANIDHGKLRFESHIEGYGDNREIDDKLWSSVAPTLPEVSLCVSDENGSGSDPSRQPGLGALGADFMGLVKMFAQGSQTSIIVEAAGQEHQLEVNLIRERIIDVKKMMQEKLGVPVERLHLIIPDEDPDEYPWPVDDEVLAAAGVTRGSKLRMEIMDADESSA